MPLALSDTLHLTEKTLAALPVPGPDDPPQIYRWDTRDRGFGVVVGRTGRRTFVWRGRVAGGLRKVTIGVAGQPRTDGRPWTVQLARAEVQNVPGRISAGQEAAPSKVKTRSAGPTLREALEFHLGKMQAGENRRGKVCSPRSIETLRGTVERHLEAWLDEPLVDITADVLDKVRAKIERETRLRADANPKNPPGRALANRLIVNVKTIWRSWHKRHGLPVACPADRLDLRALAAREERVADTDLPDWHAKLYAKGPDGNEIMSHVRRDMQLFSMFSSVRADGVRHLRWEDVDFEDELIRITHAKGGKPYTVPMTKTLREILERRESDNAAEFKDVGGDSGWVFPSLSRDGKDVIPVAEPKERHVKRDAKGNPMTDASGKAIVEGYLPGLHVNRRTYNSVAIDTGVPKEAREALMNHEGRGVNVKHYASRPENWDHLREQADKIEAALWARIRGEGKRSRGKGRHLRALP